MIWVSRTIHFAVCFLHILEKTGTLFNDAGGVAVTLINNLPLFTKLLQLRYRGETLELVNISIPA